MASRTFDADIQRTSSRGFGAEGCKTLINRPKRDPGWMLLIRPWAGIDAVYTRGICAASCSHPPLPDQSHNLLESRMVVLKGRLEVALAGRRRSRPRFGRILEPAVVRRLLDWVSLVLVLAHVRLQERVRSAARSNQPQKYVVDRGRDALKQNGTPTRLDSLACKDRAGRSSPDTPRPATSRGRTAQGTTTPPWTKNSHARRST
ncbi:hypothetical protein NEOLEDRAFT_492552 [Neolentinus lepideus HHB14362 ss-1]|uniref:Uncharacterized protein n=1 Tax=Neolentinus lepideus HHB14362 ss-1 TaxID=1314782 RepID=A0A165RM10_9AGAM|nr:hypothetical protein NEOLEDRAFT_492552 [Neolentinus lepideus HHB14362 ss-1]